MLVTLIWMLILYIDWINCLLFYAWIEMQFIGNNSRNARMIYWKWVFVLEKCQGIMLLSEYQDIGLQREASLIEIQYIVLLIDTAAVSTHIPTALWLLQLTRLRLQHQLQQLQQRPQQHRVNRTLHTIPATHAMFSAYLSCQLRGDLRLKKTRCR